MSPESPKSVEELYWDHVRAMVAMQIRERQPHIDDRALKFAVARRY